MRTGGHAPSHSGPAHLLLCHDPLSFLPRETLEDNQPRAVQPGPCHADLRPSPRESRDHRQVHVHLPPGTSAGRRRTASFSGERQTESVSPRFLETPRRGDDRGHGTDLLAALLEHVLLLLCHQLPAFAAEDHPLGAGDVLHVDHQLGAVQRVTVAAHRHGEG